MTKTATAMGMTRAHNCKKITVQEKAQTQKEAIKKYCIDKNIDLLKIINYNTNDFAQKDEWLDDLIKNIEKQKAKIDMIIFYSWDRITRTDCGPKFRHFLDYCKSKNIELHQTLSN
jgi:DNA invertase Pin-like site-specific DNA recombinase